SVLFSVVISAVVLAWNEHILRFLFGRVEAEVMGACITYLRISAYSYPALAVYNAGAAMYRSFGKTKITMNISIIANAINIVGNCIGVFVLKAGVAGVAWPSLISRCFTAVAITYLCFSRDNPVHYIGSWVLRLEGDLQKKTLRIAVPNGVESGVFQLVKVALSSMVALFGTYQIAANGVAQTIWSVASLVCVTMGPVFITVIGQCMGANDVEQAEYYFRKLTKITVLFAIAWNVLILALTPVLMHFYNISEEAKHLTILLVLIHNVFSATAFPFADPLGKGLRATGDVRFTTIISLFTTIGVRLVFSYIFAIVMNIGVIGIGFAMCLDWVVRGIIYWWRFKQGKWKTFKVI
ncbi:MAG: MATE family efflux transporter, partial [Eubacteriales bacterium]|nr:MATE family efflux transporter [Eubacteriales bacterium]